VVGTAIGPARGHSMPFACERGNSGRPQKRMYLAEGDHWTSNNATELGLTFENFTLAHCESINRKPPECFGDDQLRRRAFSVRKLNDHKSHCRTCVIPEACAQFLRYPNRVVVHVSVRSSRKCSKPLVDILDIAITGTAVNMYTPGTLFQRQKHTFTKPVHDGSVRVRVPEHIHRERYNR
jgi:hypothetical protein